MVEWVFADDFHVADQPLAVECLGEQPGRLPVALGVVVAARRENQNPSLPRNYRNARPSLLPGMVSSAASSGSNVALNRCAPAARNGTGTASRFGPGSSTTE